jgi:hypothetical protein
VTYQTDHMLDKNRDFVVAEHQALLAASENALARELFAEGSGDGGEGGRCSGDGASGGAAAANGGGAAGGMRPAAGLRGSNANLKGFQFVSVRPGGKGAGRPPAADAPSGRGRAARPRAVPPAPPRNAAAPKRADRRPPARPRRTAGPAPQVGSQFKRQLAELASRLAQLQPHYVRCVKPNPRNQAMALDAAYALEQLKCGGGACVCVCACVRVCACLRV